jgi:pyridoxal phosphate enzyme (YggS family)
MTATDPIAENLSAIRARIAEAARSAGRAAEAVTLVAVAKTHPAEAVEAALAAGQTVFGENRVQEAQSKYPALRERFPALRLHLIGPLQTNKVKEAVALFDVIQTLDRPKLADALADARDKTGHSPRLFLQVNTGEEPQKAGVMPRDAGALIAHARKLELPLEGLMCIPPVEDDAAPHFAFLAKLARDHGLSHLSMGMSDDFELAVKFGATHVRVGTAIFGARQKDHEITT